MEPVAKPRTAFGLVLSTSATTCAASLHISSYVFLTITSIEDRPFWRVNLAVRKRPVNWENTVETPASQTFASPKMRQSASGKTAK